MTADGLRFVCWFAAEGDYRGRIDLYLVLVLVLVLVLYLVLVLCP